jgi:hypothetical protein
LASVNHVAHKDIVALRYLSAEVKQLEQVVELPVDISDDFDWR